MRTDLDHLPPAKQRELARVVQILLAEFDEVTARATQPWRRNGKIYKIILFGSFARDDWVDEPENGYQSDFDLLIVVSHRDLTEIGDYWYVAEDKILRDQTITRPVNIIVHSIDEVNQALKRGEYFWVDILRDGIALYELANHPLTTPKPLTSADAHRMAQEYFDRWLPSVDAFVRGAGYAMRDGDLNKAAFDLHQATERLYISFLLVSTLYFPRSHNIKFLRSLAEAKDVRLIDAWPRTTKLERRCFELLKRAYVEARYSASYSISRENLDALTGGVRRLRDLVEAVAIENLEKLQTAAASGEASPPVP
jgi:uncharacterized protein